MAGKRLLAILLLGFGALGHSPAAASPGVPHTEAHTVSYGSPRGCSAFCLDNGDYCLFGANQDNRIDAGLIYVNKRHVLKTGWDASTSGQYARWVSKYGSVTFVHAGYQLAWAGMNEAGLVMSTMALAETRNPPADERPPLGSSFWAQYQLDNHGTVEEVIASDSWVRIADTVDHYLVCDRTGDCATIEFLEGEMVCHSGELLPVKALTNSVYEDVLNDWEMDRHLVTGLLVHQVSPDSAAAQAGIKPGDWIVAIDDLGFEGDDPFAQLSLALRSNYAAGDEVKLTVLRRAERDAVTITVKLEAFTTGEGKQIPFLGHMALSSGGSLSRFVTLAGRLEAFEPASTEQAVLYAFETLEAVASEGTAWSIVFDPANLRLHFRSNRNPQIRYVDLHSLDFSCDTPVTMLDVHANLSGDIQDHLVPYSHKASLDHLLAFVDLYEPLDLHPLLADALLTGLESFPCMEGRDCAREDAANCLEGTSSLLPPRVTWIALWVVRRVWPVWALLALLSLAFVVWHATRSQAVSRSTLWVWVLVVGVLGPVGLLVYLSARLKPRLAETA